MEKTLKFTVGDTIKLLIIFTSIISAFIWNQVDIAYLKGKNATLETELKEVKTKAVEQQVEVAGINEKLNQIGSDVTVIKEAIIGNQFNPNR